MSEIRLSIGSRRNKGSIYSTCSAQKGQITTFVVICASGHTIPPMHIFPGKRFSYNPMEGGVDGAYFG